jgi:peptidoglycan-associated lipoprotein
MTFRIRSLVFLAVAAGSLSACHKKKPEVAPTVVTPPPPPPPTTTDRPAPPPTTTRAPEDPNAAAIAARAAIDAAKANLAQTIYYDYDRSDIRDDARAVLDAKVPVLKANPGVRLRIAGHTDERGSGEYNMALGQKRAAAARGYLAQFGIDASRVDIVSYGEERPAKMGEGEESWGKNRRAEFEIVAGADQIRPVSR